MKVKYRDCPWVCMHECSSDVQQWTANFNDLCLFAYFVFLKLILLPLYVMNFVLVQFD